MQFSTLIDVAQLSRWLDRGEWVILDCRFALVDPEIGHDQYLEGHIPGAHHADLEAHLSSCVIEGLSGRHPLPDRRQLSRRFREWGVNPHVQIVSYDHGDGAFAARLWWLARWLGHTEVAVLNGGLRAWRQVNGTVEEGPASPRPKGRFRASRPQTREVDAEEVLSICKSGAACTSETVIVDARAHERFRGDVEPIDPVAGHIPTASCMPFGENLDDDGYWLDPAALRRRFAGLANVPAVSYCGSGVTAAHNILAMVHAGLPEPSLYPGSWSEWIQDPTRPIARGDG